MQIPDPARFRAAVFDLDGVVTRTSGVHARAWKRLFDDFLRNRAASMGGEFIPFDPAADYPLYVSGKLRQEGARSFLASRGIPLPEGSPSDPPEAATLHGLCNRKNTLFLQLVDREGVDLYPDSLRFARRCREAGWKLAIVTSSRNGRRILKGAGLEDLAEVVIDGIVAAEKRLPGKPAPHLFLQGAAGLGVPPARAVVLEDATAGVAAGKAGGFGLVVGVDRTGIAEALLQNGADLVVSDVGELEEALFGKAAGGPQMQGP